MSVNLNNNPKPNFDIINKNKVAIKSLRTQLAKAKTVEELSSIAADIVELETQIAFEKSAGYAKYQAEKKKISMKIDKLQRSIKRSETVIDIINKHIEYKTSNKELKAHMNDLEKIYKTGIRNINEN
jgi:septal ring factor EnvC (AmiA/AmiB activator)